MIEAETVAEAAGMLVVVVGLQIAAAVVAAREVRVLLGPVILMVATGASASKPTSAEPQNITAEVEAEPTKAKEAWAEEETLRSQHPAPTRKMARRTRVAVGVGSIIA